MNQGDDTEDAWFFNDKKLKELHWAPIDAYCTSELEEYLLKKRKKSTAASTSPAVVADNGLWPTQQLQNVDWHPYDAAAACWYKKKEQSGQDDSNENKAEKIQGIQEATTHSNSDDEPIGYAPLKPGRLMDHQGDEQEGLHSYLLGKHYKVGEMTPLGVVLVENTQDTNLDEPEHHACGSQSDRQQGLRNDLLGKHYKVGEMTPLGVVLVENTQDTNPGEQPHKAHVSQHQPNSLKPLTQPVSAQELNLQDNMFAEEVPDSQPPVDLRNSLFLCLELLNRREK
ncbi:hypothetical protein CPB83DRAFT_845079 [Crepidotus variabilis]|uniref:Uncharacterized protein n=1 Tax=Crepidotus variabilis TaxID=179855 RepID=A0A9P6ERH8_9AGAR|nr:hypothetical protein CPB83DRAFT_845079 [Crepidotus variabilis]